MNKIITSRFTLPLVWIVFFVLTHWPVEEMPDTPFIPHIDKVVHFSLYAVLGFLLSQRVISDGNFKKRLGIVLVVLAAYGAFDEISQPYMGRTMELIDWIADVCGAMMGIVMHRLWTKKNRAGNVSSQHD